MKKEELLRAIVDNVGKRKTADCATSCMVGRAPPDDRKKNVGRSPTYRLYAHPPENQFGLTCRNATEIVDVKDRHRFNRSSYSGKNPYSTGNLT